MQAFPVKSWVTQTRGKNRGRTGMVHHVYTGPKSYCIPPLYVVQFGSCGPYSRLQHGSLVLADPAEVARIMGCRVRDLPDGYVEGVRYAPGTVEARA